MTDLSSSAGMGQTVHTLTVSAQSKPTSAHRSSDHRFVLTESEGYVK